MFPAVTYRRRALSLALAFSLLTALLVPASGVYAAEANDDPATAPVLPASGTFSGSVGSADYKDFYRIENAGGKYLRLQLSSADSFSDVDIKVYAGASQLPKDLYMSSENRDTSSERIDVLLPPGDTVYTVEVLPAYVVTGVNWNYTLTHSVATELTPRLSGTDRFQTSYAISRSSFATAPACVIASGLGFPDALAASGLAGEIGGPILLTDPKVAPAGLIAEIQRLGVSTVYIVGGKNAVTLDLDPTLAPYVTSVVRLSGANRYDTSYKVAAKIAELRGVTSLPSAFVVRGDAFADALAVAPFAYREAIPVLLTESTSLSAYASAAIRSYDIDNVFIAGGATAVSSSVAGAIDALPPVDKVERWFGSNRYATAVDVANEGISEFGWVNGWETIGVATGVAYPDALSGGVTCGVYGGPLLLTDSRTLSGECRDAVYARRASIDTMVLFGGTAAVSDSVRTSLRSLIP